MSVLLTFISVMNYKDSFEASYYVSNRNMSISKDTTRRYVIRKKEVNPVTWQNQKHQRNGFDYKMIK